MHKTTVNLGRHLRRAPIDPAWIVVIVFGLAAFVSALGRVMPSRVSAQPIEPTPALMIVFATAHPTQPPTQPTPDQQLYVELAALRARVVELEAERAQPIVVTYEQPPAEQPAPAPAEQPAPAPAEQPAPPAATEAPAAPPPPEAPAGERGPGGSGTMVAPHFDAPAAISGGNDATRWCAAAASAGHAQCVGVQQ